MIECKEPDYSNTNHHIYSGLSGGKRDEQTKASLGRVFFVMSQTADGSLKRLFSILARHACGTRP
jgi:hypothetical protein